MTVQTTRPSEPSERARSLRGDRPPLNPGDRLSRAEFERRYSAYPEIKKAELIEGVVYVPSPTRIDLHSEPHGWMMFWIATYALATPGVRLGDNATVRLSAKDEVQPDGLLRLETRLGGRSHVTDDGYLEGPPEFIVEVAASSAAYDLHQKRRVYARSGVQEYLAAQMYERRMDWFVLREGVYKTLAPDTSGVLRSEVFPGLWLQPTAFWANDWTTMSTVLQEGLASPEHAAFVERLKTGREQQAEGE